MTTLALDASTYLASAALWAGARLVAEATAPMRGASREHFLPMVADVLSAADVEAGAVRRIVCGAGPGSFTSLRIAASIAKGLATGSGCDLFAVPSLALIVAGAALVLPAGRYLAVLDALRGECYVAAYDLLPTATVRELHPARLVPSERVSVLAAEVGAKIVGPGRPLDLAPHARGTLLLESGVGPPVDLGRWEPAYGRLAEAQVRWESAHGRPLSTG